MRSDPPAHAERLDLMHCFRTKHVPSRFCPGRTAVVSEMFCPACGGDLADPGFEMTATCRCGLHLQSRLSGVHVWRAEETATQEPSR